MTPAGLNLKEAAEYVGVSIDTLKRAAHATDPNGYPHPIKAKRAGNARNAALHFRRVDLDDWLERMPDA